MQSDVSCCSQRVKNTLVRGIASRGTHNISCYKRSQKRRQVEVKLPRDRTFSSGVGVGERLVRPLPHEGPLVLLVVPTALDDLLVQLPQSFVHLDFPEGRVQAADVQVADLLGKHPTSYYFLLLL